MHPQVALQPGHPEQPDEHQTEHDHQRSEDLRDRPLVLDQVVAELAEGPADATNTTEKPSDEQQRAEEHPATHAGEPPATMSAPDRPVMYDR